MKIKIENSFPIPFRIAGFTLLLFGLFLILQNISDIVLIFFGLASSLLGILFISTSYGIELNKKDNTFKEYTYMLGFTLGKFKNLTEFVYISIVKADHGYQMQGRSTGSVSVSKRKFEVSFYNLTFRKNVLTKICNTEEEAVIFAKHLALETGLEVVKFNPPVSQSTMNRRRSR